MSYQWVPRYCCSICGKVEDARMWRGGLMLSYAMLPDGWSGSESKSGTCYCDRCTEGIARVERKWGSKP